MEMSLTRVMQNHKEALLNNFKDTYSYRDLEYLLDRLQASIGKSNYSSELFHLRNALQECDIPTEPGMDFSYYKENVERSGLPRKENLNHEMAAKLIELFQHFPGPDRYLERIVNRQEDPRNGWAEAPLRLRLLRQFVQYCDGFSSVGFGGKTFLESWVAENTGKKSLSACQLANSLTDDVFAVLQTAEEKQQKPKGRFGLLKMVDDLAKGNFRPGGRTRQSLYLFAIAYQMSFYYGADDTVPQYQTDIRNLFADFYNNNLMRFLRPDYQNDHAGGLEVDPNSRGINVKNFVEVLYLYWIVQNTNPQDPTIPLSPLDKLQKIREDMQKIKDRVKQEDRYAEATQEEEATRIYWERVEKSTPDSMVVFEMSESDMIDYLLEHYDCNAKKTNPFALANTQKSACACYKKAVLRLKKAFGSSENDELRRSICNQWLSDLSVGDEEERTLKKLFPEESLETVQQFNILVDRMKQLIHLTSQDLDVNKKGSNAWKAGVTRTKLLAVYYSIYNLYNLDHPEPKNLARVFDDLAELTNDALEESGYQPMNAKSLFDVMLAVSSYIYLTV